MSELLEKLESLPWKAEIEVACGHVQSASVVASKPRVVIMTTLDHGKAVRSEDSVSKAVVADCGIRYAGLAGETIAAHANLISAAPELYEALEGALKLLEMDGSRHNIWRRALAKARGEQP